MTTCDERASQHTVMLTAGKHLAVDSMIHSAASARCFALLNMTMKAGDFRRETLQSAVMLNEVKHLAEIQ